MTKASNPISPILFPGKEDRGSQLTTTYLKIFIAAERSEAGN